jgi:hypothetical protein
MYSEAAAALNDAVTVLRPLINTDAEEMDGAIPACATNQDQAQLFQGRY